MALKKPNAAAAEKKAPRPKPAKPFEPLKFKEFTITQKRTGKFQVLDSKGKNVNGPEKVKLLLEAKVMKGSFKKPATEDSTTA
jgi:hypothetical protein